MNEVKTVINVNGKKVNTKLTELPKIEFKNWSEVFNFSHNLISVCQSSLYLITENRQQEVNDYEHNLLYGSNGLQIFDILETAKNLIPQYEDFILVEKTK